MTDRRRRTGELGERLARTHLERAGYEILDQNFRTRHGELDLVAADRRGIVFCEVKTRIAGSGGPPSPFDAIGTDKRRRLRRMATEWLMRSGAARRPQGRGELRFDAIGIRLSPSGELLELEHLENAF
jgi:putative endonuclease